MATQESTYLGGLIEEATKFAGEMGVGFTLIYKVSTDTWYGSINYKNQSCPVDEVRDVHSATNAVSLLINKLRLLKSG